MCDVHYKPAGVHSQEMQRGQHTGQKRVRFFMSEGAAAPRAFRRKLRENLCCKVPLSNRLRHDLPHTDDVVRVAAVQGGAIGRPRQ